ncbi:MAG: serine/threonine-protein kinase, partial [Acidobacteriota bacterium]
MNFNGKSQLGHYRILSQLGAGGMGEVFLAEDTRLERKVALKLLPEKFSADSEPLNRFKQEAKAASALNHPNIITVYEIGDYKGTNFIATEFIDGKTLRERMKDRLTFDEILSIVIQTSEALSAAHQAGIVHRDIKPANIMIRPDGYVKVLDFGLAKLIEQNKAEAEDATRKLVKTSPGVVMGTVAYMSPEQARGKDIDARSDVFSFGIVLYEMLAGKVPFAGETMTDVLAAIINSEPQPLSSFAVHLPKELQRIVNKTLKKKREQRYHSTRDLLNDLKELRDELLLESKLDQTAAPNKSESSQTSQPRLSISSGGSSVKDSILLTEFENSTGEAIFDQTLKTALAFALAQSPFLDIFPDAKVSQALRLMGRAPGERVSKDLGYEICLRQGLKAFITGTISNFGNVYVLTLEAINARSGESLGREFEQVSSREEVLNALSRAATGLREKLGESLSSIEKYSVPIEYITTSSLKALKFYTLGQEQTIIGKTLEAIPFLKKALEIDPKFSSVFIGLAVIYANTGQWKLAAEMAVKAFDLSGTASENEKLRITFFYYTFVTGEMDKAIDTLELWRKTYPAHLPAVINLSDCLERTGQSEKAIATIGEGLRIDANNAVLYMNLAESLLSLDRYEESKETCQKAFEKKLDGDYFHIFPFIAAFIENDNTAMAEHLAWFGGRSDEHLALNLQTGAAAFQGQWRKAQDFSRRAIDLAKRSDAPEVAAQYAAEQAVRIAFWSSGAGLPSGEDVQLKAVLKTQTNNALKLERSSLVLSRAALALAAGGMSAEANALADELKTERP